MPNGNVVFGYPEYAIEVHKAFPRFFEVLPRLTDSINDLTGREHPHPEPYHRVILNLGILTAVSMFELVTLAGNGFGLGAMKIARTVMETAINAEYLRRYPAECELYLNWHWIEQYKLLTYVRVNAPELLPELSLVETERVEREFAKIRVQYEKPNRELRGSWCSLDLGARAAKTDFSEAFRLINPISSQLIHGTFGGLARHFDLAADEHRISLPPSLEYCAEALVGGHMCVLANVGTLADAFNWVPCNPVPKLAQGFQLCVGQSRARSTEASIESCLLWFALVPKLPAADFAVGRAGIAACNSKRGVMRLRVPAVYPTSAFLPFSWVVSE